MINKLAIGKKIFISLGCHRRSDRSFFFHGKQFPVCARCTGVILGEVFACVLFAWFKPNIQLCNIFIAVMFVDWFIQYKKIKESTNFRRLITGFLCGYGLTSLYIYCGIYVLKKLCEF